MSPEQRLPRHPRSWGGSWFAVSCTLFLLMAGTARAAEPREFWPELNAFFRLDDRLRLFTAAAYARGKESSVRTLDLSGYLDLSLQPHFRPARRQQDWARDRYLWARVGYTHVYEREPGETPVPGEDRGVLAMNGKAEWPGGVWAEGRVRADLRWLSGEYSTRYRYKAEFNREFLLTGHPVTPYANAEWFYDDRFDDWSRLLLQVGAEYTVQRHFRFEVYLALQESWRPTSSTLHALGLVAKYYH